MMRAHAMHLVFKSKITYEMIFLCGIYLLISFVVVMFGILDLRTKKRTHASHTQHVLFTNIWTGKMDLFSEHVFRVRHQYLHQIIAESETPCNSQSWSSDTLIIFKYQLIGKMNLFPAALLLVASVVTAEEEAGLTYTPKNDVTKHSKIALDQVDIKAAIDGGNLDEAMTIYTEGKNREGKSLQQMAQKDWAAAGIEDLSDHDAFASLFYTWDGKTYLDSYNLDAMTCSGTFAGETPDMCAIAAKKNLLCTGLQYAQYEGVKAIQNGSEINWDELFAFWNGVYDETHSNVEKGAPGAVQKSRDDDFKTSYREASLLAIINGQKAFSGSSVNTKKLEQAYADFKKANLATFAQATLKYSALYDEKDLEQEKVDKKWGEGYTYFRCGAGLMDPGLASYINYVLDPRVPHGDLTPKETVCKIVKKMLSVPEIGPGVKMDDLNVEAYLPTIMADCDIESFDHVKGVKKSESERAFIPFIGLLIVFSTYAGAYCYLKKKQM